MLTCDRCRQSITGEPYEFEGMDLCANCFPYVYHMYFPGKPLPTQPVVSSAPSKPSIELPLQNSRPDPKPLPSSPFPGKKRPPVKENKGISRKLLSLLTILILLLSTSIVFSYYAYTTGGRPTK